MASLNQLSTATLTAQTLANLILVTPQRDVGYQPQNTPTNNSQENTNNQPPAFFFHYEGENVATLESDITDHYIEDNSAVEDMIAKRPIIVQTQGYIGELNDVAPKLEVSLSKMKSKLITISAYTPQLSITALDAYNQAFAAYQTAMNIKNNDISKWSTINEEEFNRAAFLDEVSVGPQGLRTLKYQTKQQVAFQTFYGYWNSRTLFTVQTPWAIFKNMAILSMRATQDANDRTTSNFELRFKAIRKASTAYTEVSQNKGFEYENTNSAGRNFDQGALEKDLGTETPIQTTRLGQFLTNG